MLLYMYMKKYIVEGLGAFTLTLAVALSLAGQFPVSTPILAALTLGLFVYSIGHISGAHINPAVTIGAWSIKKIDARDAFSYIVAQFIGAGIALFVVSRTVEMPMVTASNTWMVSFAEFLGTFFFTFGIASVIYGKTPRDIAGVVIGGSLLLGISLAALLGSNGVLNPAVAFGIGSLNIAYALSPLVGSILGMKVYSYVAH